MAIATKEDLDELVRGMSEALSIVVGLLAEAAGSEKLALHFAAALDARKNRQPDPLCDHLLQSAYRMVLIKARNRAPDNQVIRDLFASELGDEQKH